MSDRDIILAAIRAARVPAAPPASAAFATSAAPAPLASPSPAFTTRTDDEALHGAFLRVLAEVGGRGVICQATQSLDELLAAELGVDKESAVIVRGRFAVVENGAVYVDAADIGARNSIVLAEHLVVVVPYAAIVPTMHEAVRLMPVDSKCGWFLSGPSKTADIEQSLVFGAQGSRTHRVIFEMG